MAKPILVVKVDVRALEHGDMGKVAEKVKESTNDEYHVLIVGVDADTVSFECYNDCKGLPDIDTVYDPLSALEAVSKNTLSLVVGAAAPLAPPDVNDQFVVAEEVHEPALPTQYLSVASAE